MSFTAHVALSLHCTLLQYADDSSDRVVFANEMMSGFTFKVVCATRFVCHLRKIMI